MNCFISGCTSNQAGTIFSHAQDLTYERPGRDWLLGLARRVVAASNWFQVPGFTWNCQGLDLVIRFRTSKLSRELWFATTARHSQEKGCTYKTQYMYSFQGWGVFVFYCRYICDFIWFLSWIPCLYFVCLL